MPLVNFTTREITCKLVYYGPGRSGKTTNLLYIHGRVPEDRRVVLVRITAAGAQVIEENDARNDDLLRTVLHRLEPDELPLVARVMTEFRAAVEATIAMPLPDRHPVSTLAPRSR